MIPPAIFAGSCCFVYKDRSPAHFCYHYLTMKTSILHVLPLTLFAFAASTFAVPATCPTKETATFDSAGVKIAYVAAGQGETVNCILKPEFRDELFKWIGQDSK